MTTAKHECHIAAVKLAAAFHGVARDGEPALWGVDFPSAMLAARTSQPNRWGRFARRDPDPVTRHLLATCPKLKEVRVALRRAMKAARAAGSNPQYAKLVRKVLAAMWRESEVVEFGMPSYSFDDDGEMHEELGLVMLTPADRLLRRLEAAAVARAPRKKRGTDPVTDRAIAVWRAARSQKKSRQEAAAQVRAETGITYELESLGRMARRRRDPGPQRRAA